MKNLRRVLLVAAGLVPALAVASTPTPSHVNSLYAQVMVARNVPVAMRDGTLLAADVYVPSESDRVDGRFPTLVIRTPYGKLSTQKIALFLAQHGYAVVAQDVRGQYASQGKFYPYIHEAHDGYDTVVWAGKQSWSDGKVGTFGASYPAATQMLLVHNGRLPPDLVAMAPGYASASYYGDGAYVGGAFRAAHNIEYETTFAIDWYDRVHGTRGKPTPIKQAYEALNQLYWQIPLEPFKPVQQAGLTVLEDYMHHDTFDGYWAALDDIPFYDKLKLPVLSYSGWFDLFDQGTVQNYEGAYKADPTGAQLVMGPYVHGNESSRAQGWVGGEPYDIPQNATYSTAEMLLAFFDRYLKGRDVSGSSAPVRLYVPGGGFDHWIGATRFPLPQAQPTHYYFHGNGRANIQYVSQDDLAYDGRLDTSAPTGSEPPDTYVYDPDKPVISIEGYDQHWTGGVEEPTKRYLGHDDILVYQTAPLAHAVAIVGPVTLTLYASTSAKTTDFVATVTDVSPTDHSLFVAEGVRRGGIGDVSADPRNPDSYARVVPLVPGKVYKWLISVWPTARVFAKGHRIRIDITSSDFPEYNRNPGSSPALSATDIIKAHQTVYHDARHPSHVTLPVVRMSTLDNMVISGPLPPGYPPAEDEQAFARASAAPVPWASGNQVVVEDAEGPRFTPVFTKK